MWTLTGIMSQKSQIEYLESSRARDPSRNRAGRSAMIDALSDTLGWERSEQPCGTLLKPTIPLWLEPENRSWIRHRLATGQVVEGLCQITAHHIPSPNDAKCW